MPQPRRPSLAILIAVAAVGTFTLNAILPSMPGLQRAFDTSYAVVQLTLTVFLVGLALAQLAYGPLSDRFGRRPVLLTGLGIFLVGTVICVAAQSIETLIAGRLVQAIGGGAGLVMARAMVRDLYPAERAAAMIAYLTMAVVVAPTLAPVVGGFLDDWLGWWATFVFILGLAAVVWLAAMAFAHETLLEGRHQAEFATLFLSFAQLFRNRTFNGYAFQVAFITSAYFAFMGGAPYVMVDLMGRSPTDFGLYYVIISLAYISGNYATALLAQRLGIPRLVWAGTSVALAGALALAICEFTIGLTPLSLFGLMSVVSVGNGLSIASGTAGAISADPLRVGAAAGLAGSMQIGFGAAASYLVGLMLADSARPLVVLIVVCVALSLGAHVLGQGRGSARFEP